MQVRLFSFWDKFDWGCYFSTSKKENVFKIFIVSTMVPVYEFYKKKGYVLLHF